MGAPVTKQTHQQVVRARQVQEHRAGPSPRDKGQLPGKVSPRRQGKNHQAYCVQEGAACVKAQRRESAWGGLPSFPAPAHSGPWPAHAEVVVEGPLPARRPGGKSSSRGPVLRLSPLWLLGAPSLTSLPPSSHPWVFRQAGRTVGGQQTSDLLQDHRADSELGVTTPIQPWPAHSPNKEPAASSSAEDRRLGRRKRSSSRPQGRPPPRFPPLGSPPCLLFLPSRHSRDSLLIFRGRPRFRFPCLGSPFLQSGKPSVGGVWSIRAGRGGGTQRQPLFRKSLRMVETSGRARPLSTAPWGPGAPPPTHHWRRACCRRGPGPCHLHRSLRSEGSERCQSLEAAGAGVSAPPAHSCETGPLLRL